MAALLEIEGLGKRIATDEAGGLRTLFHGLSAVIREPASIAVMGASGQGKSTLLRMLACLETIDEGDVRLNGQSFRQSDIREWRMDVSYVAQQAVMLPGTVDFNLRTVSRLHGATYEERLASELMERCGLGGMPGAKQATELSGGEKQRLALVRSLLLRPQVLLLDEVTASLDEENSRYVEELLLERHRSEGTTLIWVTHQPEQAHRVAPVHWTLAGGRITESGVAR
ncbi:ABC transporter ATP-binding protein [Paenibacillus soyae]|uniref:ATP-binding cassette domain-containing protein n=1 Tax=Paenibacillus soyae TaxID=2969249 RepID=A0A9X2S6K2_9BACL|nr:ATP-binding cassette domain-containing protein [Paenibacillus soyae]MCR2802324.1 ATP-binding cassette domain-containing protein [Paenibacillus soyae]